MTVTTTIPIGPRHTVVRGALVDRICADEDRHALVVAPAGYGKSTLLANIGARLGRALYLRLTDTHNDPTVLVQALAERLGDIEPLDADLIHRISARALEPGLQAATRLSEAVTSLAEPPWLLIDDLHVLRDRRAGDTLSVLIEMLPSGSRLVAAGHDASALRVARLQAAGRVILVGEAELAFAAEHAIELAALLGIEISKDEAGALVDQTQGWPVAISLALHSWADARPKPGSADRGDLPRSIADYVRAEVLGRLDEEQRGWLLRSSVLDELSGPLCDAAMDTTASLARLRALERSSLLISAIDHEGTTYRYHPLLRDVLRDEREVALPGEAQAVAARAARWFDGQGQVLDALEFAQVADDHDLAAELMVRHVWTLHWSGRIATLERWVGWFDRVGIRERYPAVAVVAGFIFAIDGRRHEGELWLAAAEASARDSPMPDGSPREAWSAVLRGMMCTDGVEALAADARLAERQMRRGSPFLPGVRLLSAVASLLEGQLDAASRLGAEASGLSEARGAIPGFAMAIGLEAALALREGRTDRANELVRHGLDTIKAAGLADYVLSCLVHAVAARVAVASASLGDCRHHLAHVHRLRPMMTASVPWLSILVRLEAIEALVACGDVASARTLLREVDDILRVRPGMGLLVTDTDALRSRIGAISAAGHGRWTLTAAELRVLQYLPTHLTFGEIAERLYVSPHTVKSQAVAIYGKLGVSSRREAIEVAVEQGLLDGSALRFPLGPGVAPGIG